MNFKIIFLKFLCMALAVYCPVAAWHILLQDEEKEPTFKSVLFEQPSITFKCDKVSFHEKGGRSVMNKSSRIISEKPMRQTTITLADFSANSSALNVPASVNTVSNPFSVAPRKKNNAETALLSMAVLSVFSAETPMIAETATAFSDNSEFIGEETTTRPQALPGYDPGEVGAPVGDELVALLICGIAYAVCKRRKCVSAVA
jgi:hypothetical protein